MASIIIHIDTDVEEDVLDLARVVRGVTALLTNQSIVRSSMHAPQNLVDAAFDVRLDDLIDYVNVIQMLTESPLIGVLPQEGQLVFGQPGVVVDEHLELPPADRYITVYAPNDWYPKVKNARVDA